jgi:uncharacterized protein YchJ
MFADMLVMPDHTYTSKRGGVRTVTSLEKRDDLAIVHYVCAFPEEARNAREHECTMSTFCRWADRWVWLR